MEIIEEESMSPEQLAVNQRFLEACRALDIEQIQKLVRDESADAWFQEPETGKGPLHLVIEGANKADAEEKDAAVEKADKCLSWLMGNGAVWNQMDREYRTPACRAREYGLAKLYANCIDAGVRAELLLAHLNRKQQTSAGARNEAYLNSKLTWTEPTDGAKTLLDDDNNGVMMSWEKDIMKRSAEVLVPTPGEGSVLNIGFGLGIVDTYLQERRPKRHVIVEAHPDVIAEMKAQGWDKKPGVEIVEGRWQDVVGQLAEQEVFDSIYYDAFGEYYEDLREFFDEAVGLLSPDGILSFFHGLGADNQTFYDVYTKLVMLELYDFGLDTEWEELYIDMPDEEWEGTKRRYWALGTYRLPICKFLS
ncbi:Arginine N-methyltransferase 2 [Saitoella coloradoensis]